MKYDGSSSPLILSEIPVPEQEMKGQLKSVWSNETDNYIPENFEQNESKSH